MSVKIKKGEAEKSASPRVTPRKVSEAPHSPNCLLKMLASTQTATRPTRPSLPRPLVTATTFPMTSTGKNGALGPNISPTMIAKHRSASPRSTLSLSHAKVVSNFSLIVLSPYGLSLVRTSEALINMALHYMSVFCCDLVSRVRVLQSSVRI